MCTYYTVDKILLVFIVNWRIIKKIDEEKNNCNNEKYFSEKP